MKSESLKFLSKNLISFIPLAKLLIVESKLLSIFISDASLENFVKSNFYNHYM